MFKAISSVRSGMSIAIVFLKDLTSSGGAACSPNWEMIVADRKKCFKTLRSTAAEKIVGNSQLEKSHNWSGL